MEKQAVLWPTIDEQQEIKHRILLDSGFPSCIGFIDGTLFVLENKPHLDGEDYYSRKGRYGISGLIVCDDNKRIRYIYTGWPGCTHDARVFENCALARLPEQFFVNNEYLLADSGYTPSRYIIPAFKKPPNRDLSIEENQFNYQLSNIRVRVEHCIGILKGRFQSLKGLRIMLRRDKDIKRAVYWIRACCVIHNLVLQDQVDNEWLEDEGDEGDEGAEEDEDEGGKISYSRSNVNEGRNRRRDLMSMILS